MHLADTHFAPQDTLLLGHTFQSHILLPRTFYSSTHFVLWIILPLNTFCFLKHFALQHYFLPKKLCFLRHSAPWNTLLPETLCSLEHFTSKLDTVFPVFKGVLKLLQEANSRQ